MKTLFISFVYRFPSSHRGIRRKTGRLTPGLLPLWKDKHWQEGLLASGRIKQVVTGEDPSLVLSIKWRFVVMPTWQIKRMQAVIFQISYLMTLRKLFDGNRGITTNGKVTWKLHLYHQWGRRATSRRRRHVVSTQLRLRQRKSEKKRRKKKKERESGGSFWTKKNDARLFVSALKEI